jgi:hypothetical protein
VRVRARGCGFPLGERFLKRFLSAWVEILHEILRRLSRLPSAVVPSPRLPVPVRNLPRSTSPSHLGTRRRESRRRRWHGLAGLRWRLSRSYSLHLLPPDPALLPDVCRCDPVPLPPLPAPWIDSDRELLGHLVSQVPTHAYITADDYNSKVLSERGGAGQREHVGYTKTG